MGVALCGSCNRPFDQRGSLALICATCRGPQRWVAPEERNPVERSVPTPGDHMRLSSGTRSCRPHLLRIESPKDRRVREP
jgi:hypothetical protein